MIRISASHLAIALACSIPLAAADFPVGPGAPADLSAAPGPGAGAVTLAWAPAQSLTGVTAYRVYHVQEDGSLDLVATLDGGSTGFTETGLGNGVTVAYAVSAVDAVAEGPASGPVAATTFREPGAPVDARAAPGGVGEVVVSWGAPESDGGLPVTAYRVYRDGALVAEVPADAFGWTDAGLAPLHDHAYQVSAVNEAGEGPASEAACAMAGPWIGGPPAPACLGLA